MNLRSVTLGSLLALSLSACREVELYSGLQEREGNQILAMLLAHNIPAQKTTAKTGVTVLVDEENVASAVDLLRRNGYPRDSFDNLGDMFKKEGLISSPLEERVRYIYGLSQTIAETLNQIDGVLTARVHIVLPKPTALDDLAKPSAASVFIKYRPGLGIEEAVPKIKLIVRNSIEGLPYDNISVALFPAQDTPPSDESKGPPLSLVLGIRIAQDSVPTLMAWLGLLAAALGGNAYLLWRLRRANRTVAGGRGDG